MQNDLRALKKRSGNASDSDSDSDAGRRKGPSYLEQELAKYSKQRGLAAKQKQSNRKGKRDEEDDLLAAMAKFSKKVKKEADEEAEEGERNRAAEERERKIREEQEEFEGGDVDDGDGDDDGWMKHDLKFEVDDTEQMRRAEEDYSVSDAAPRCGQVWSRGCS